jgi:capsular polysaccharide biosynthesis protein
MNDSNLFSGIFDTLKRNWKLLAAMAILSAVTGIILSVPSLMPPRYTSTAVVYPANLYPLSDESETEQMLQLLADDDIQESLLNKFEMYKRGGLIPGAPEYRYWADLLYQERVSISPTRYESVEITCQDETPEVAKQMVESILDIYNSELNESIRVKHEEYKKMTQNEMNQMASIMDSLKQRMSEIRTKTGILDFESQSERYTEGYVRMIEKGSSGKSMEKVESLMKELAGQGSEVEMLQAMVGGLQESYAELAQKAAVERSKVQTNLTYFQYVVRPQTADKKSYPVRWVILVLSVVLTLIGGAILIVAYDKFKDSKS